VSARIALDSGKMKLSAEGLKAMKIVILGVTATVLCAQMTLASNFASPTSKYRDNSDFVDQVYGKLLMENKHRIKEADLRDCVTRYCSGMKYLQAHMSELEENTGLIPFAVDPSTSQSQGPQRVVISTHMLANNLRAIVGDENMAQLNILNDISNDVVYLVRFRMIKKERSFSQS
jgi:hypothetical protein